MDSRFSYCAVSALSLLGRLDDLDKEKTVDFVRRCGNFDGGFGMVEGAESHAAYGAFVRTKRVFGSSTDDYCFFLFGKKFGRVLERSLF